MGASRPIEKIPKEEIYYFRGLKRTYSNDNFEALK